MLKDNSDYILEELNEKQKEAVICESNKICIIAGPGCGKTKTLMSRLIYLIKVKKINPSEILVLSFSKNSTNEMKKRTGDINNSNIFTFHSFCFSLLKSNFKSLNFSDDNVTIYDNYDQEEIIEDIINEKKIEINKKKTKTFIQLISIFKVCKALKNFEKFENLEKTLTKSEILNFKELYEEYEKKLNINKAVDYSDLLCLSLDLLNKNAEIKNLYRKKYKHIMIDEFQDVSAIQWEITQNIFDEKENNIFIVGDPNQAIYGFRGVDLDLFEHIRRDESWNKIYININYRSTQKILNLINSFVENNNEVLIDNKLKPYGETISFKPIFFSLNDSYKITREIKNLIKNKGVNYGEIAILYRSNFISSLIVDPLIKQNLPYRILGSFDFSRLLEIKNIIFLLRLAVYKDDLSISRVLKMQKGIGKSTINKITMLAGSEEKTIFEYLINFQSNSQIRKKEKEIIEIFISKIKEVSIEVEKECNYADPLNYIIETIMNLFDYQNYIFNKKEDEKNKKRRKRNIKRFLNYCRDWEKNASEDNIYIKNKELLIDFLEWFYLKFEKQKEDESELGITLSTIHQIKGMEFKAVFVIYLNEGIFPSGKSENSLEEKRLFYVAITRAKEFLYLVSSNRSPLSVFLYELNKDSIEFSLN